MTMMLPTTLSMLFLMTLGCPPEELPQPAEPVALASEDSVRGLLDQAERWRPPWNLGLARRCTAPKMISPVTPSCGPVGFMASSSRQRDRRVVAGVGGRGSGPTEKVKDFILQGPFFGRLTRGQAAYQTKIVP